MVLRWGLSIRLRNRSKAKAAHESGGWCDVSHCVLRCEKTRLILVVVNQHVPNTHPSEGRDNTCYHVFGADDEHTSLALAYTAPAADRTLY